LNGGESVTLDSTEQVDFLRPGTYTIEELAQMGWILEGIVGADSVNGAEGTVILESGEIVTLTFKNRPQVDQPRFQFWWAPIYPDGIGGGYMYYGPVSEDDDSEELTSESSAEVFGGQ
jgi:hypothetical protein